MKIMKINHRESILRLNSKNLLTVDPKTVVKFKKFSKYATLFSVRVIGPNSRMYLSMLECTVSGINTGNYLGNYQKVE
tara:strand:+ start:182 stop:415 length:234 start_codon:yes stop_codon:yes gene_type:complete